MNDIATLTLRVDSLEAKVAKQNLADLEGQGKSTAGMAKELEQAFWDLVKVLGPAYLAHEVAENVKHAIELEEAYGRLAEVAGTTAANISGLDLPARLAGTALDSVAQAVARLGKSIGDARLGNQQQSDMLKALGIDVHDGRDAAEVMVDVAKALVEMKDQTVAAVAAQQLLNRSYIEMRPFLKDLVEQGGIHATITNEQAKAAKELTDKFATARFEMDQQSIILANQLLPALTEAIDIYRQLLKVISENKSDFSELGGFLKDVFVVVLQTIIVLGSEVAFTFKMIGGELGVWAAQLNALAHGDFKGFHLIAETWKAEAEQARKDHDAFIDRVMKINEAQGKPAAVAPGGAMDMGAGGVGAAMGLGGGSDKERNVKKLMEDQRLYEQRLAEAKAFGVDFAAQIDHNNKLADERQKQGYLSEEELIRVVAANEEAKLAVLEDSYKKQEALAREHGDLGKAKEMQEAAKQAGQQRVMVEEEAQAKIDTLRDKELTDFRRRIAEQYGELTMNMQDQFGQLEAALAQRERLIEIAREEGIIGEEDYNARLGEIYADYEEKRTQLLDEQEARRYGISQIYRRLDMDSAKTFFGYMSGLMQTKSKELFEIGKVAAIAEITVNTAKAAMGAYAALASIPYVGPALATAAAAAAIAAGIAQIQQVKATQFGGGGGATGTFAASPTTGLPVGGPTSQVTGNSSPTTIIHLYGDNFSGEGIRQLVDKLNESTRDGGKVMIAQS